MFVKFIDLDFNAAQRKRDNKERNSHVLLITQIEIYSILDRVLFLIVESHFTDDATLEDPSADYRLTKVWVCA